MLGKAFKYSSAVGLSILVYQLLSNQPPPVPKLDYDEWWGPHSMQGHHDESIHPFEIVFSDVMVNDLKERLVHRRLFTSPLEGAGFSYGFNSIYLERILVAWLHSYNFEQQERYLNRFPHYKTNIQGLDVHYIHVKPNVEQYYKVVPLLLMHSWPGSVREFYELIPMLTTPNPDRPYVFEIIAPSLPGFGYSEAPRRPGLGSAQAAVVMRNLMHRVGHERFYIHGGNMAASIGTDMSILFPKDVLGLHSSFLRNWSPWAVGWWLAGTAAGAERLTGPLGTVLLQATAPDTIGIALTSCPAGLAAYVLEKFSAWNDPGWRRALDGELLKRFHLSALLDNVMLYWSTGTMATSMRMFAETLGSEQRELKLHQIPTYIPAWALKFEHDLFHQPDWVIRRKYVNLLHSTMVSGGGHFAALENAPVTARDIFDAVDAFIRFNEDSN